MTRFAFNQRTCQMEQVARAPRPKTAKVLAEVKRRRHDLITAHTITDEELTVVIDKILGGTRNLRYLVDASTHARLADICTYIVRQYSYR